MAELYCFGRFTLNPDSRQLYADGMRAKVGTTGVNILLAGGTGRQGRQQGRADIACVGPLGRRRP
ncbi:MAG TPA: hypothetical protein VHX61_13695 [Rhizomicrobium sp.]|jgi:hypothetical protein|nr:hypothetical protein [Rhizomicrobium sp.]